MKNKETLRIIEWNLNFATNDNVTPASFVNAHINGNDIVVLTEVRANKNLIRIIQELGGYDYIISDNQGKFSNQIVILTKKKYKLIKTVGALKENNEYLAPDFLHGTINVGGKTVNIVGVRIKAKNSYPDRYKQAELMRDYIASIEGPIICTGDFNSGQIRGSAVTDYSTVKPLYKYQNRGKVLSNLRFYNFHKIRELLGNRYVLKEPTGEDNSWGLSENDGKLVYGLGSRVKNDLLFHSADIEGNSRYSWNYVRENEQLYTDMIIENRGRKGNKIDPGYPDHAILIADLTV